MQNTLLFFILITLLNTSCEKSTNMDDSNIKGYSLLSNLTGHWIGTNETAFGIFDWFAFDFRPISSSHLYSIYEGGTNQNIITSLFIADYDGQKQIMARNGGWLGNQYRATYFLLDVAEENPESSYYRLVDAIGGEKRAYMEFRFEQDTMYFDAYKDNSGSLDEPIHHMGFKGKNLNPNFAKEAVDEFNFPQEISEIDLNDTFNNLIDPDSALFLEESADPFPKSQHGYLSDLSINISRDPTISNQQLLLYISKEPIIDLNGQVNFNNINTTVIRTIDIQSNEDEYITTYLHPDTYYITAFSDIDGNFFPSSGDVSSVSTSIEVTPENIITMDINVNVNVD